MKKILLLAILVVVLLTSLGFINIQPVAAGSTICGQYIEITIKYENPPGFSWEKIYGILVTSDNTRLNIIASISNSPSSEGYYRIYDAVIDSTPYKFEDGTYADGSIVSLSSYEKIGGFQDCVQAPTQPPIPPPATCQDSAATNFGQVGDCIYPPPVTCQDSAATNFGQTGDCIYPPPATCQDPAATNFGQVGDCAYLPAATWTPIPPTQRIISTLVIPAPVTDTPVQSRLVGLQVQPINQLIPSGNKMSNGNIDYGLYNCAVASTAMAFQYLQSQGVLDNTDTTDYLAVRDKLRCQVNNDYATKCVNIQKNADPAEGLFMQAIVDFAPELTHNKLKVNAYNLAPEHFEETIRNELNANRPVIAAVPDWSILPGHSGWAAVTGHSILIHGLQDGKLYYIDPWGGKSYERSVEDYIKSALYDSKSLFIMIFEPTPTK